jgi:cell division protein ZipA
MDADILRVVLIIAGLLLLLGIYLWDRYKRIERPARDLRERLDERPVLDREPPVMPSDAEVSGDDMERELDALGEMISEGRGERAGLEAPDIQEADVQRPDVKGPEVQGSGLQQPDARSFDAQKSGSPPPESSFQIEPKEKGPSSDVTPARTDVPELIIQVNVVAVGAYFSGPDLLNAARETGLDMGAMNIFHRRPESGSDTQVMFSMASMVEPGVFPVDAMDDFSTPGITLFAQFPGTGDPLAVFSDMLFTAQRLASLLDGELQDETHSAMTRQTIEHVRERIMEHKRRMRLAQSR